MASAQLIPPQPPANSPVLASLKDNTWSLLWRNYWFSVDHMFRTAQIGPLVNAANDGAAAAAGVEINQMYRNNSVVMIRVT